VKTYWWNNGIIFIGVLEILSGPLHGSLAELLIPIGPFSSRLCSPRAAYVAVKWQNARAKWKIKELVRKPS
jgi:hypothetical protein